MDRAGAEGGGSPGFPELLSKTTIEAGILAIRSRWPELRNDCEDDPVFVLSAGWRSGSTLLQRLIVEACFLWGEPFGHSGMIDSLSDHLRCFNVFWPEGQHFYAGEDAGALSRKFIANLYPSVQDLLLAHQGYFDRLFARPARRAGASRWGIKEVRLSADHAVYLRWLFPRAKFVFLIRNPFDAWRSYAAWVAQGWTWYDRWPDEPVTLASFAATWTRLVASFLEGCGRVDGLVVRYEDLAAGAYDEIERYLGFRLSREAGALNPYDGGPRPRGTISEEDRGALAERLGPLAESLGYAVPPGKSRRGSPPAASPPPPVDRAAVEDRSPQGKAEAGFNRTMPCRHGVMLYNGNDTYIGRALELYGEWSEAEVALFGRIVRPGDVVIEAGANVGAHTVPLARLCGPGGAVLAFEPQRIVFQALCANMALNSVTNAHCHPDAVGREPGVILVPRLDYRRPQNYGALALGTFDRGEPVKVVRLDDLGLRRCRLLKADVEGMEIDVLQGARRLIAELRPILYVENSRPDRAVPLVRLIDGLGYDLYWHRPPYYSPHNFRGNPENVFGAMTSLNVLAMPRGQAPPLAGMRRVAVPGPNDAPQAPPAGG